MGALVLHPDVVRRRERIDGLRLELAGLFDEYVRINLEELPALRHRYAELFGDVERRTQERMLELRQRKRMVELLAIKLDRGQKLDPKTIELVMRTVMNENGEVHSRMNRAMRVRGRSVTEAKADSPRQIAIQARDIYRRLARRLHPDARGGVDAIARRYWDVVQQAYLRVDIALLRALDHLVHEMGGGRDVPIESLDNEERRLSEAIASERRRVGAMRDTEPYTLRDALFDGEWINQRREQYEAELASIDDEISKCNVFLGPIFEGVQKGDAQSSPQDLWEDFVERMYLSGRY